MVIETMNPPCILCHKYNEACLATNSTPSPHPEIRNVLLKHVIEWKHSKIVIGEGIAPVIEDCTWLTSFLPFGVQSG